MAARKRKVAARSVRCSSLLTAARCPATIAMSEEVRAKYKIPDDISNEGSRLGHAYHKLQAFHQKHGYDAASEQMQAIAREEGADLQELGWLWSRLRIDSSSEFFDEVLVEESFAADVSPGLKLTGTPDLVRLYNKRRALDVIDWKSGRLAISDDPDAYGHDQIISYAVLASFEYDVHSARALVYPIRLGDKPTVYTMDGKALAVEQERIYTLVRKVDAQRELAAKDRTYGFGTHCRYCDGRRECPAYRKNMETAVALVDHARATGKGSKKKNEDRKELIKRNAAQAVAAHPALAYDYMRLAGELNEELKEALKLDVEFWGEIDTNDGKYLGVKAYKAPASLTADYAREQIAKVLSERISSIVEAEVIDSLVDDIDGRLRDRPMLERQRFGHYKKTE